jgi:hypothetical protein
MMGQGAAMTDRSTIQHPSGQYYAELWTDVDEETRCGRLYKTNATPRKSIAYASRNSMFGSTWQQEEGHDKLTNWLAFEVHASYEQCMEKQFAKLQAEREVAKGLSKGPTVPSSTPTVSNYDK